MASLETDLVEGWDDVVSFFKKVATAAPAGDTTIPTAAGAVTSAAGAVQAAIPALAESAANAALDLIPFGPLLAPEVDQIIVLVIQKLEGARAATAATPAPTAQVAGAA
jgi:hypothetical protein